MMKRKFTRFNIFFAIGWLVFEVSTTLLGTWLFVAIVNCWWQPLASWWQHSWWWYSLIVMGVYSIVLLIGLFAPTDET